MPRYGFCSQCNQSVWLTEQGACPNGHGAECISGVTEMVEQPQPLPQPLPQDGARLESGKGSKTWLIVIAVLMIPGMLLICGILTAIAIPVFNSASTGAEEQSCFAYERMMEGGYAVWLAESPDHTPEQVPDYRTLEETLLAGGHIPESLVCASGGTYEFSNGEVTCSTHGHY